VTDDTRDDDENTLVHSAYDKSYLSFEDEQGRLIYGIGDFDQYLAEHYAQNYCARFTAEEVGRIEAALASAGYPPGAPLQSFVRRAVLKVSAELLKATDQSRKETTEHAQQREQASLRSAVAAATDLENTNNDNDR
jgi:hypothetical protein